MTKEDLTDDGAVSTSGCTDPGMADEVTVSLMSAQ